MTRWCRITALGPDATPRWTWVLEEDGQPDLAAVDKVARLALEAVREGGRVVVDEVVPAMLELLELVALPLEVRGQAERGEEALGVEEVQEEGHLGDPPL
jgi:hypothetical protein